MIAGSNVERGDTSSQLVDEQLHYTFPSETDCALLFHGLLPRAA